MDSITQTKLTFVEEINILHTQAQSLANTSREYASKAIQIALEIGARLVKVRSECEKGKWIEWQQKNLNFHRSHAHRYISLYERVCRLSNDVSQCETRQIEQVNKITSKKILNDAKSMRQAMEMVGIIPQSSKEDKSEKITPTITFTKPIDAFVLWFNKRTANEPIEKWLPETRAHLITNLRPIVAIYQELIELQDNDNYSVRDSQRVLNRMRKKSF